MSYDTSFISDDQAANSPQPSGPPEEQATASLETHNDVSSPTSSAHPNYHPDENFMLNEDDDALQTFHDKGLSLTEQLHQHNQLPYARQSATSTDNDNQIDDYTNKMATLKEEMAQEDPGSVMDLDEEPWIVDFEEDDEDHRDKNDVEGESLEFLLSANGDTASTTPDSTKHFINGTCSRASSKAKATRDRNKYLNDNDRHYYKNLRKAIDDGKLNGSIFATPLINHHMFNLDSLEPLNYLTRPVRIFIPHVQYNEYPESPCGCMDAHVTRDGWKRSFIPIFSFSRTEDYYLLMPARYKCTTCSQSFNADDAYCMSNYSDKVKVNLHFYLSDRFGVDRGIYKRITDSFVSDGAEKIAGTFKEESLEHYVRQQQTYYGKCAVFKSRADDKGTELKGRPKEKQQTTLDFSRQQPGVSRLEDRRKSRKESIQSIRYNLNASIRFSDRNIESIGKKIKKSGEGGAFLLKGLPSVPDKKKKLLAEAGVNTIDNFKALTEGEQKALVGGTSSKNKEVKKQYKAFVEKIDKKLKEMELDQKGQQKNLDDEKARRRQLDDQLGMLNADGPVENEDDEGGGGGGGDEDDGAGTAGGGGRLRGDAGGGGLLRGGEDTEGDGVEAGRDKADGGSPFKPWPSVEDAKLRYITRYMVNLVMLDWMQKHKHLLYQYMESRVPTALRIDYTFKIARKTYKVVDKKRINPYRSFLTILDETGHPIAFLACTNHEKYDTELADILKRIKRRCDEANKPLKLIYVDNCCQVRNFLQGIFGLDCKVMLDLFHWLQRWEAAFACDTDEASLYMNGFSACIKVPDHEELEAARLKYEQLGERMPSIGTLRKKGEITQKHTPEHKTQLELATLYYEYLKIRDQVIRVTNITHPETKMKPVFRLNNIGPQKKTLEAFVAKQFSHIQKGCLSCPQINNNLLTANGKIIQGGETSSSENVHGQYNAATHHRCFGTTCAASITTKINFDQSVKVRKDKYGEQLGETKDPLNAALCNSLCIQLGLQPHYPAFQAPLEPPKGSYGYDSCGGDSIAAVYLAYFEKTKKKIERELELMKRNLERNVPDRPEGKNMVDEYDWNVTDEKVNDRIQKELEKKGVDPRVFVGSFEDEDSSETGRCFLERMLLALPNEDNTGLPFVYDTTNLTTGDRAIDEAHQFDQILEAYCEGGFAGENVRSFKFIPADFRIEWQLGIIVEEGKRQKGENHRTLAAKTEAQLQEHFNKMHTQSKTSAQEKELLENQQLKTSQIKHHKLQKKTSQIKGTEPVRLSPSKYKPLDDPNKAFAGGAAGGGTTLRADNRQTQARTANNPTAPFILNIPKVRDGDMAINSFIPDMRLFNKICKFCGDARHKDFRLVEHRTWKTCENACVRCRKKHLPGSCQGVFCTEIITEEQETDWKVFKKYGDLTERGYELLQKCPHPSVFYERRRGINRTLEAFQGFDWNDFSDGINGDGGEEKKETKKTDGGLDYNGGEEREDGDDSGKKADKRDDTAGDDNGRANKDAKSGGKGKSDEKKDTVGDGSAKRKKKDPLADLNLREMLELDKKTKRRRKVQSVKKDKSARSQTRQIDPSGADLSIHENDVCYRSWMEVGAFFPVLPNVVNENCFPYEYRWDKNQPPFRSGDFKEFKECMDKYEIEIHFVDFLDNTLDKQLKSWVRELNRRSLLPIKYTSQVCESAFIESAAKSDSSAETHVRRGSSVRQNNLECGPIAAGVTLTGYRQWQDDIHPKDVDFGKCILRPSDEFIDQLVGDRIYDSRAAYGKKYISGGELLAIQQIMGEENEDFVQPCMHIGQAFEILFRGLVRELKSDETGPTICLFNNQCHHRAGQHWASLFLVKRERKDETEMITID